MSTAAVQISSRGRISNPASPDPRWLTARFVVTAAAVSAMGVGNICKYPYLVSRHGGGAFFLVYLVTLVVLAFPILMAELMVGRKGRCAPAECFGNLAQEEGHTWRWKVSGYVAAGAALLILAAYAQAAGSSVSALVERSRSTTIGLELLVQGIFLGLASVFASHGLRWGLRPLHAALLPATLILLLGILLDSAFSSEEFSRAQSLVFHPDFTRLTWWAVLDAGRLALLTVGVGLGLVVSYGSAISGNTSILKASALTMVTSGVLVLLGALTAVAVAPSSALHGFLLLSGLGAAASIFTSLAEQVSSWTGLSRSQSGMLTAAIAWAIAAALEIATGASAVDRLGTLGVNLLVPLAALCSILFVGWAISRRTSRMELGLQPPRLFVFWRWMTRYPLPLLLAVIVLLGVVELVG